MSMLAKPRETYYETGETHSLKMEMMQLTGSDRLYERIFEESKGFNGMEWILKDAIKLLKKGDSPDEIIQNLRRAQA